MDIPVDFRFAREHRIGLGSEPGRDIWGDDAIDEFIEAEGWQYLMDMKRKGP